MSDKKQFLIFVCVFALIAIIVGWVYISTETVVDNVTKFTIIDGKVVSYNDNESVVELPYVYKINSNGDAVFGYDNKVSTVSANTFSKYNKIERLAISNYITTIENGAFNNLGNLEVLVLRGKVPPNISASEIDGLTNLKEIYVYKDDLSAYLEHGVWSLYADKIKTI